VCYFASLLVITLSFNFHFCLSESVFFQLLYPEGFPYEVLAEGHYLPGPERGESAKYKNKDCWPMVMTITDQSCIAYFERVHEDFNRAVGKNFSAKLKDFSFCLIAVPSFFVTQC